MKILHYKNAPGYKGTPLNWTPVVPRVEETEEDRELGAYEKEGHVYAFIEEGCPSLTCCYRWETTMIWLNGGRDQQPDGVRQYIPNLADLKYCPYCGKPKTVNGDWIAYVNRILTGEHYYKIDRSKISDGYHTFEELYEHRNTLLCAFLLETEAGKAWKSKLHHDGSSYDGWFVAGVTLPTGEITYHLPMDYWDLLQVDELEMAPEWDGHTPTDVVDRIQDYIIQEANSLYQTAWR